MTSPLRLLIQYIMVRRNASTIPTCIRPLEEFKRILVLIDGDAYYAARVAANIEDFFVSRGKELTVLAASRASINIFSGSVRKKFRLAAREDGEEDMFISLIPRRYAFASKFEAIASPAKCKIGCSTTGQKQVFDLTVTAPDNAEFGQLEAFWAVVDLLDHIQ